MRRYFGTDGIRGAVDGPLVNTDFAARLGVAVGAHLKEGGFDGGQVLIGQDGRPSGDELRDALASGLAADGFNCISLGVLPTPAISFNVRDSDAVLGVSLTASHNPASDNGFKFFLSCGRKVGDQWETEIESRLSVETPSSIPPAVSVASDKLAFDSYCCFVKSMFPTGLLNGLKISVDTANGATSKTTPDVLSALGASLIHLGNSAEGGDINSGVGSEYPDLMADLVSSGEADLGLAHDGDGDRLVLCDESGAILSGDEVLGIVGLDLMKRGSLDGSAVVGTIQCNAGLDFTLNSSGVRLLRTGVGDRLVTQMMFSEGYNFGGEPSGHFVLTTVHLPTGDGLIAALHVLEIRKRTGRNLADLRKDVTLYPQSIANVLVADKPPLDLISNFQAGLDEIKNSLGDDGRVLVRYSGTESKIRLLAEGRTQLLANHTLDSLLTLARSHLNLIDNKQAT